MHDKLMIPAIVLVTMAGVPAVAKDRVGYQAIAAGGMVDAERTIQAERDLSGTL